jgi:hypothetical protein
VLNSSLFGTMEWEPEHRDRSSTGGVDVARKSKVFCPECGAKNGAEVRRCRVCSNLLNVDAPEERRKVKEIRIPAVEKRHAETMDRPFDAGELKAVVGGGGTEETDAPAIPSAVPTGPALPVAGLLADDPMGPAFPVAPADDGIEIGAVARHAPPPPPPPEPVDDGGFVVIEMEVAPRHAAPAPPPPPPPDEEFEPFTGIEMDVVPRHAAPPPPPPPPPGEGDGFRLDDLEVEPPR